MSSISRKLSYKDEGAPQLWANQRGCISELFEKVLVTGYGDTAGLGWTKEYESEDESIKVFRSNPNEGCGLYLQVIDRNSELYGTNVFKINLFESMSDYKNGFSPMWGDNLSDFLTTGASIQYAISTGTTCSEGIHWMIIGDDRGFWFCTRYFLSDHPDIHSVDRGRTWGINYIGEYLSYDPSLYWTVFYGQLQNTYDLFDVAPELTEDGISENYKVLRSSNGKVGNASAGCSPGTPYETTRFGYSSGVKIKLGRSMIVPVYIHDSGNLLGCLPGGFSPLRIFGIDGEHVNVYDEEYRLHNKTLHFIQNRYFASSTGGNYWFVLVEGEDFRVIP